MNYPLMGKMRRLRRSFNVCTATRRADGVERSHVGAALRLEFAMSSAQI